MKFVPVSCIQLDDPLWAGYLAQIREDVLPYMWEILNDRVDGAEKSHCIENFRVAAGESKNEHYGTVFIDTDLYKWIEAVSYCLAVEENPALEDLCDSAIELIEAAQQSDGYLNTYFSVAAPEKRWTNLMEGHELYCAGHLIEAGVAHFQGTGKKTLLRIAQRFADLIDETFGNGKSRGYPGHPVIELALVRLYEVTGDEKYLSLAAYFVNERGMGENIFAAECKKEGHTFIFPEMAHFGADYFQVHQPVRQQACASGHAVRAMYLYSAMADLARLTDDPALAQACKALFQNTVLRQMYVTGGIGSARTGERFTVDFDLPSDSNYAETCASIGLMFFAARMWLLDRKKLYYDIWEQALCNTVLSAMGRDGRHFFYVNPLEVVPQNVLKNPMLSHVKTQRQKWFGVACCPPNIARILTSMIGYIYALEDDRLYILSHIGSRFEKGGLYVNLSRKGDEYTLTIEGKAIDVFLRLPANSSFVGSPFEQSEDGYLTLHHPGGKQQYTYILKPLIRVLRAHPAISALAGKICVQRGLTIYCVEGADNAIPLSALRLPGDARFIEEKVDWLGEYFPMLKTSGYKVSDVNWEDKLYDAQSSEYELHEIRLIPYNHWGNRGENEMRVWLNEK